MERTKDCRGTPQSDRRQNRPVLHVGLPPGPRYGGRIPGAVPRIRRGQGRGLPSFPRRCRWSGNLGRVRQAGRWKARLVQAAVEAGSGNGGPVGTPAPTPNLWIFAGGWYPPLRSQRRESLKKPGRVGNSRVQTAEMANQHLTNISGGGAVGILGQNPNFLIHVERKHHRNAFFLVRHIIHLRGILREYPLKGNEQGGTTS